jgi:hypothetical protein
VQKRKSNQKKSATTALQHSAHKLPSKQQLACKHAVVTAIQTTSMHAQDALNTVSTMTLTVRAYETAAETFHFHSPGTAPAEHTALASVALLSTLYTRPHTHAQAYTTRQAPPATRSFHRGTILYASYPRTRRTQVPRTSRTPRTAAITVSCASINVHNRRTQGGEHTTQTLRCAQRTMRPQTRAYKHTQSFRATLTLELSDCPASTGCCRRVGCCTATSPCRTHEQPSRHTMAPDAAPDPSQPPAT